MYNMFLRNGTQDEREDAVVMAAVAIVALVVVVAALVALAILVDRNGLM